MSILLRDMIGEDASETLISLRFVSFGNIGSDYPSKQHMELSDLE